MTLASCIADMARYIGRCSKRACSMRFSLPRHPDDYKRGWRCAGCHGMAFRLIADRPRDRCAVLCNCGGYQWVRPWARANAPHRRGSPACWYRKDGSMRMPGDADFDDPNYADAA